ncbi:hypothetical protein ACH495_19010 [Micromonospora sp. NPDC018662]|uniref:hypothetical protein n=1 Tax=Micromonospora sp. NPDC018662 TaxID=3364238 RepID=UPI0037884A7E
MSSDRQPGGATWNVRSLIGDLADELPPTLADRPVRTPPSRPPAERPVAVAPTVPTDAPTLLDAAGDPELPDQDARHGWVSHGEVVPRTNGNSLWTVTALVGIGVLVIVLILAVVGLATDRDQSDDEAGSTSSSVVPETRHDEPVGGDTTEESLPEPTTTPTEAVDPEDEALSTLQVLSQQDLPTVTLDGGYAAQLASKAVGIQDPRQLATNGSHTFYARDILAEHNDLRDRFGGETRVVLLSSTDYGRQQRYEGQPLWVTFALPPESEKDAVAAWCAREFSGYRGSELANRCVPRRLNPPGASS